MAASPRSVPSAVTCTEAPDAVDPHSAPPRAPGAALGPLIALSAQVGGV